MSSRTVASTRSGRLERLRRQAAQHPHAALLVDSAREQLAVGIAMACATFANALVHPYTVPGAWQLASAVMFGVAIGLTGWLVVRAAAVPAEVAPR